MPTYQEAGVDITKADKLVEHLGLSGFGAVIDLEPKENTVVLSCDGVGTKILVAEAQQDFTTIGIDCVAMVVNDLLCQGARPHSFLDYYATGRISLKKSKDIMDGILKGCSIAGCKLVGGETAEMPGMYRGHMFDLAGFGMGIMEKMIPSFTQGGETIIGIPSSGPHSNGFSLLRKTLPILDIPLTPTRIYTKEILDNLEHINAAAHITGGGIHGNLTRILHGRKYELDFNLQGWWADLKGRFYNMERFEFESTFNCGWGMMFLTNDPDKIDIPDAQVLGKVL